MKKKILCAIALMFALVFALASCGGTAHTHSFGEWETVKSATATTKGVEERICECGEKETRDIDCIGCDVSGVHNYEKGKCASCGLKVFDVIKEYLIKNGENDKISLGSYQTDQYHSFIGYDEDDGCIYITSIYVQSPGVSNTHRYAFELILTPYTFEDGYYEWSARCNTYKCDCPSIYGTLDPTKFSSATSSLEYTSSATGADTVARNARKAFQENINEYYISFFSKVGSNISFKDLGFVRY